jgi:hypothetical protein
MDKLFVLITAGCFGCLSAFGEIDLKESKFTQVVNDVEVISTSDNGKHAATVDGVFKLPDVLRTGASSRAELVAEDRTITRVGANTIFSFDAAKRSIDLQQGSLLFNSPKGKGGGSIHTAAATAAVLGTTIIVTTTTNGGFKVLTLEGTAKVKFANGFSQQVHAGQLMFVLPGSVPGPVVSYRLDQQTSGSKLVSGFSQPLPSMPSINTAIAQQIKQIQSGQAQDTGLLAGNNATKSTMQVVNPIQAGNGDPTIATNSGGNVTGAKNSPGSGVVVSGGGGTITTVPGGFLNPDGFTFSPSGNGTLANAMGAATATLTDATISSSTLDPARVFLAGLNITGPGIDPTMSIVGVNFGGDNGFFARNITFNTPTLDLSAYSGMNLSYFDIIASEDLTIASSLNVTGIPGSGLYLTSGGVILVDPGVTVTTSIPILFFTSRNGITFNSALIQNSSGEISLGSGGPIVVSQSTLNGGSAVTFESATSVDLFNSFITAPNVNVHTAGTFSSTRSGPNTDAGINGSGNVSLVSGTGMTIGTDVFANLETGSIQMNNASGLLTVNNGANLQASSISISSPNVLIDSVTAQGSSMSILAGGGAGNLATVQNSTLNVSSLAVSAYTVVLNNVNMFGQVNLTSSTGQLAPGANTGAAIVPGDVNFVQQVLYQGQPAQNYINNGITLHNIPVP